ncbi:hypothetical protein BKN38_10015 [Helicobacter sp. CLO-3]|uniref:helix-turn-helix transcriptional regulator n=1 Tax=unclassified Helicobacter TaxID=2593540 RepID=UPI000805770B|nr:MULTISPECIES: WYL domain-containing protein [unclassified Helicobacter]OBV28593.1 hypothetical protein BA723_08815 [Helicobacter sp. CLO-3]OHU80961.1 hypothetical protein BKN38_10015 [Helicobacter sp. CLO-3]
MPPSSDTSDSISTRLVDLFARLCNGERLRVNELAKEYGVSIRTLQRDITRLTYLPLRKDSDASGLYYTLESYAFSGHHFKDIKQFAKVSGIDSLYPKLDSEFITDLLNPNVNKAYLVRAQTKANISYEDFQSISIAILEHICIGCMYHDKPRILKPYKLLHNAGIWYLLAEDNHKLKSFSLSKIENLKLLDNKHFKPKQELLNLIAHKSTQWISQEPKRVTLRIKAEAREYFSRKEFLPNVKILREEESEEENNITGSPAKSNHENNLAKNTHTQNNPAKNNLIQNNLIQNNLIIEVQIAHDDELLPLVRAWIPYIEIIAPKELKEKLLKTLQEYIKTTKADA